MTEDEKIWWYESEGKRFGPYSAEAVKALVNVGSITASDSIWKKGWATSKPAANIHALLASSTSAEKENASAITLSPPEPQIYHSSRWYAAKSVASCIAAAFSAAWEFIPRLTENSVAIVEFGLIGSIALLIFFRKYLVILLKNPVWLQFGPEGIGGYPFGRIIPWHEIKDLGAVRMDIGDTFFPTYLDVYLHKGPTRIRVLLYDIDAPTQKSEARIYEEALAAFSFYVPERTLRTAFPRYHHWGKLLLLAGILMLVFLVFAWLFAESAVMKILLITLFFLDIAWMIFLYLRRPSLVRENATWIQLVQDGIGGPAFERPIRWQDIIDLDIEKNLADECYMIIRYIPLHPSATAVQDAPDARLDEADVIKLRIDTLFEPHMARLARDCLMAFERYANATATQKVPARLNRFFTSQD